MTVGVKEPIVNMVVIYRVLIDIVQEFYRYNLFKFTIKFYEKLFFLKIIRKENGRMLSQLIEVHGV